MKTYLNHLAYALNKSEGIEFLPQGLGQPDDPCLRVLDLRGTIQLWIDISNPTARRMHTACIRMAA
jgi:uncharacterized protein YaeQ